MSNYVYNDKFSSITTEQDTGKDSEAKAGIALSKRALIISCCCILLLTIALGVLSGVIFGKYFAEKNPIYNTNTIYIAPPASQLANDRGNVNLADLVAQIEGSVVEIKTEFVVHANRLQAVKSGAGSGVIVGTYDENNERAGYNIITNTSVIHDDNGSILASSITVTLNDGDSYEASVLGYDLDYDVAVLRISESKKSLPCASFASSGSVRVGESVIAIGNPIGEVGSSVTSGIISALDKRIKVDGYVTMNLMQTNASINPGNSGGGLFDMSGRLVGIISDHSFDSGVNGLGFVVPSADAQKAYSDITNYGYVQDKPFIGVEFKKYLDAVVRVESFIEGYSDNELAKGDKIISVNGTPISDVTQITEIVKASKAGDTLSFVVIRGEETITASAVVDVYHP